MSKKATHFSTALVTIYNLCVAKIIIYRVVYKKKTENVNLKFINIGFLSISAHLLPYIDSTLMVSVVKKLLI